MSGSESEIREAEQKHYAAAAAYLATTAELVAVYKRHEVPVSRFDRHTRLVLSLLKKEEHHAC